jgi:hypothetical protein
MAIDRKSLSWWVVATVPSVQTLRREPAEEVGYVLVIVAASRHSENRA